MKYSRIINLATTYPWAIMPDKLAEINELLALKAQGGTVEVERIEEVLSARGERTTLGPGAQALPKTAILPLVGTIVPRGGLAESSGALSIQTFTNWFRAAMADDSIERIVLDVDSPGGQTGGLEELSQEIFESRGQKPSIAVVNYLAASAAYWIASAASEMVVSPSGAVGSIGVFFIHKDLTRAAKKAGVKFTIVSAGKFKAENSPYTSLSDEARAAMQETIDDYYNLFTNSVARNRGVDAKTVVEGFGQGRMVSATKAVALGMVDRIGTLSEVIASSGENQSSAPLMAHLKRKVQIEKLRSLL